MYDYIREMAQDIKKAIDENYDLYKYAGRRDDFADLLNDDLWADDSVTGNGSGSYFCNWYLARQAVQDDGMEYLKQAIDEFGISAQEIGERFINEDWEWMDCTIRCYLLRQAIEEALEEMENAGDPRAAALTMDEIEEVNENDN